ncbi:DUF5615 family PIN-like protein [Methylovirgula sp. 4M-Z18]|uniref:DUF5615 family PIN-like protein n=1 Tax=Methylovirgula sp. 4M-Z18 TaxID=2293567 RepID=UPI001314E123
MRFFIDECISPTLSQHLNQKGLHDVIHPRDRSRLRDPDHVVFARAIDEDRIIVTENADDFRKLAGAVDLHPGLIILPSVAREGRTAHGPSDRTLEEGGRRTSARPGGQLRVDHLGRG